MVLEGNVDSIRVVLALSMLGYATYSDLKNREISDFLWAIFGGISVVLIFFSSDMVHLLTNVGISLIIAPVVVVIWRLGFFGGADAFGLVVLAALVPEFSISNGLITPFTVLTNSVVLSIIPILFNILRNLISLAKHENIFDGFDNETKRNKILALFLGYKAKNPKFSFSIETHDGDNRKLDFSLKNADNAEFCSSQDTWVTPGIPYMIYITFGFVIQLVYGDIIFNLFRTLH
ncbi:MAG: A24 family peptidase C-terminal domain-containing protein [Nitrosotalea sp.]